MPLFPAAAAWSRRLVLGCLILILSELRAHFCEAQQSFPTAAPTPSATNGGGELDCSFQESPIQLGDSVSFQHVLNPADNTLTVELTYQGTGWVGFGASADGQMPGSEVVIAKPDEAPSDSNPGKYSISARTQDAIVLSGQQTLVDAGFEQSGGATVLRFTKALAETGELEISANGSNTFVYAVGSSNTFGYHAQRGSFTVPSLTRCVPVAGPTATAAPSATATEGGSSPAASSFPTAPSAAAPSLSPTASPAATCDSERAAVQSCVTTTGDVEGCVACLEVYAGSSSSATTTCEEALAETCGIDAACPACGNCRSNNLALLSCLNADLCGDALECAPTSSPTTAATTPSTATPASSPPPSPAPPSSAPVSPDPASTPLGGGSPSPDGGDGGAAAPTAPPSSAARCRRRRLTTVLAAVAVGMALAAAGLV